MNEKKIIKKIEKKREALKNYLLSNGLNFNDKKVIKLSQELDELILCYVKAINKKKTK
jgi:hypothetical protein